MDALVRLLNETWDFANWLTHTKSSRWFDAEVATSTMEHALGYAMMAVIRHLRGVPDVCPACGSHQLNPQRGFLEEEPELEWERPTCTKCDWMGESRPIFREVADYSENGKFSPEGECIIPAEPLRQLRKPSKRLK